MTGYVEQTQNHETETTEFSEYLKDQQELSRSAVATTLERNRMGTRHEGFVPFSNF